MTIDKKKTLDDHADGFLMWIIKSRYSWFWLSMIFLSGWFGSHYYDKWVHQGEYANHSGYESCLNEVQKLRLEFQSLLGE